MIMLLKQESINYVELLI